MNPIPGPEEIRRGETTDIYFRRTMEVLRKTGHDRVPVVAEIAVKSFPGRYDFAVLSGMEEMLSLLAGRAVDAVAMAEGALFFPGEPVASIAGPYGEFCEMETALLGVLCQASGVATRTARIKRLAGDRTVLSFGARRMHPALSTLIDRNAFIGGADGVSVVRSAAFLGEEPQGTMPHALILLLGDTVRAARAFDETVDPKVPRICLIDTLQDEKFEAIRVAEALGKKLAGVRLDTPASRRGNFRRILREVRWELDLRGHSHVRILVSGGVGEEDVAALRDLVDGFGVGTSISNAPTIDFALDLVEVEGNPLAKRGKLSGAKQVVRCSACGEKSRSVVPAGRAEVRCGCGGTMRRLLLPAVKGGKVLVDPVPPRELRRRVLEQVARFRGEPETERR
ncbi:MAG: nicotinate phosphoribosyltransferase [Deltaproteobacteria bacterium]